MLRTIVIAPTIVVLGARAAMAVVASPEEIQGAVAWIDTYFVGEPALPHAFSFLCDGIPSAQLLPGWRRTYAQETAEPGTVRHVLVLTDPKSGLELTYIALFYLKAPFTLSSPGPAFSFRSLLSSPACPEWRDP